MFVELYKKMHKCEKKVGFNDKIDENVKRKEIFEDLFAKKHRKCKSATM